ncbi:hypothetical protein [Xanthocytophaga flava]|uniref:hypothetical protein n=1 Tax=Xanthocytophaga flava TaxID=3048013 RepID=UPI0028D2EA97|nr:hypothetical protein [Xanthocytophaga flavus]MDJ1471128.1 hypothetical protein [Xanthocytophaga flavus]
MNRDKIAPGIYLNELEQRAVLIIKETFIRMIFVLPLSISFPCGMLASSFHGFYVLGVVFGLVSIFLIYLTFCAEEAVFDFVDQKIRIRNKLFGVYLGKGKIIDIQQGVALFIKEEEGEEGTFYYLYGVVHDTEIEILMLYTAEEGKEILARLTNKYPDVVSVYSDVAL